MLMLKEHIKNLLILSEDDKKPLIKWFDAFEKALNKLRGSYSKINPTDMLELYYAGVSPEDAASQLKESVEVNEATKWKMGDGKPRGGSHIENIRFWDLTKDELQYIIKDAGEAMKANPKARKATSGRGNWADQVNDAHTVLGWRKKNGIKESMQEEYILALDFKVEMKTKKGKEIIDDFKKRFRGVPGEYNSSNDVGFDASFSGSKNELQRIKKYVESTYEKELVPKNTMFMMDERTSSLPKATAFALAYSYAGKDNKFVTKLTNLGGVLDRKNKEVRFDFKSAAARTKFRKTNKDLLKSLNEKVVRTTFKDFVELGEDRFKTLPGKEVAKRMKAVPSMKPYVAQVAKLKKVNAIDLERLLPHDKVSVKDIDRVMYWKESIELDEAKDYRVELEKRHIKALTIIRHIDKILGKQGKWTDSFGEYVTKDMPDGVDTSIDAGWSYHQNRGRGEWFFTIEPKDVVKYNYEGKAKIDFAEKSGRMKIGEFTKFISKIWAKLNQKGLSSERPTGSWRNESVELGEDSHWVLSFEFNKPEYTSTLGRQIQNELRRKFKKTYSGSGSGGAGWDISFNGSEKELEKAKKYVEKEYKKFIDSTQTQFVMDESVERTFRRWEEVSDDACTIHKRCGKKNDKHLLINPLRGYPQNETEEVEESVDAAANNIGGGAIAGASPGEEPPVKKKRKKFAGCDVFEVDTDTYYKCVQGKKKFEHWKRYFDRETGDGAEIYEFAYKYPRKAIIVQNKMTQEMVYLRHKRK